MRTKGSVRMIKGGSNKADPEGKYILWNPNSTNDESYQTGSTTRSAYNRTRSCNGTYQDV